MPARDNEPDLQFPEGDYVGLDDPGAMALDPAVVESTPAHFDWAEVGGSKQEYATPLAAFPDWHFAVDDLMAEGDIVEHWEERGGLEAGREPREVLDLDQARQPRRKAA